MVYDGGQGSCIKVEHLCITNCRKRNFLGFGGGTTAKSEAQTETEHGMMVPMHGGAPFVAESGIEREGWILLKIPRGDIDGAV